MTAELLCLLSFVGVFFAGRKSIGYGLVALLTVGYAYGLVRANVQATGSHFIFDAAVVGLYLSIFMDPGRGLARYRSQSLQPWLLILTLWPLFLFFVPRQDWLIQFVGLRGAVFFLPFLLVGARMEEMDFMVVAKGMALLDIIEVVIGLSQLAFGIQRWFPRSAVTQLIYTSYSGDVAGGAHRIPATFVTSASYGGIMAFTVPFILAGWLKTTHPVWRRAFEVALLAAGLGVFLSASRTSAILLGASLFGIFTSVKLRTSQRVWIFALLVLVGVVVARDPRLQRFMTLGNTAMLSGRIQESVNSSFIDMLMTHPMGNGLGGGGTSIPYFLQERSRDRLIIENEYGLILIEQGVPGLLMWLSFVVWVLVASWPGRARRQYLPRLFLWYALAFSFIAAPMGTGLLTAIPMTPVLIVSCGWLIGRRREQELLPRLKPSLQQQPALAFPER